VTNLLVELIQTGQTDIMMDGNPSRLIRQENLIVNTCLVQIACWRLTIVLGIYIGFALDLCLTVERHYASLVWRSRQRRALQNLGASDHVPRVALLSQFPVSSVQVLASSSIYAEGF